MLPLSLLASIVRVRFEAIARVATIRKRIKA